MKFRSSTFMPSGFDQTENSVWYEAHETGDGRMILASLSGLPSRVGRPGLIKRLCTRTEPDKAKTLPSTATVLKTVHTRLEALDAMLKLEQAQLVARARFIDIGDARSCDFGGLPHYASVKEFEAVSFPESLQNAVSDFVGRVSILYLLGHASRSMIEGAREAASRYENHGRSRDVMICVDESRSMPSYM